MTLIQDGQVIACGLGVQQAGYVGLLDIVTDEAFRSRGFGQQLVASILAWGKYNGASKAWLGVMLNNPPALRLYAKLGFREVYQYWYRIASS
jgi:ribosomal protein S18 acetylase RimI-like enzyme